MKRTFTRLACAAIATLPLACAQAATLTVTSLADAGSGSLRAAVSDANAAPGHDSIRFQAGLQGTITLTREILVTESVSIEGPGPSRLTVAGSNASRLFRLARAGGARTTVVLAGLTFANGQASDGGGAILVEDENLIVRNALFSGNVAETRGGAIRHARGDLTLEDVVLLGNHAGAGSSGGAIDFSNSGTLRLLRCVLRENTAGYGGALRMGSASRLQVEESLFMDNDAAYQGGAIEAGPTVASFHIARSALVGNSSNQAIAAAIGFAGSDNPGDSPGVIENTTLSANHTAHSNGRGILAVKTGTLHLRNSTLAFNRTATGASAAPSEGGAVWVGAATLHIDSSVFAFNTHGNAGARVDIAPSSYSARVLNVSHSLLHTNPGGLINGIDTANLFDTDARLHPLTIDAGPGFVPLHPIGLDSPAIDAGSNPANLATDQRGAGYPRRVDLVPCRDPQLARSDIGAFEYRTDTIFCHGFQG